MYKNIIKILDKSKEKNVTILTARDMVVNEENIDFKEMKKASDTIAEYHDTITKCRRLNDNDTIKKLIEAIEAENFEGIKAIKEEVADRVEE